MTSPTDELARAQARPDFDAIRTLLALHTELVGLTGEAKDTFFEAHDALNDVFRLEDDPDKGLAYVVLAAATSDDPDFLSLIATLCLEDLLGEPNPELIARIEGEARRSARLRWMLGHLFPHAISVVAAERLLPLAIPYDQPLPPRRSS